ncbi:kinase-like domain-containing protein [Glomus cerebriforme]|uniref:Kinase-like domain-containing protein n=1 Tax=Glomus cerebriforme TaxID=658196 RepID=A0A397SQR3_9GLOM|nr:kinase-like domain-containing protein [Glomus cerebriforme]
MLTYECIDMKIKNGDIEYFKYNGFSNMRKVGEGAFGAVNRADWKKSGIKITLKSNRTIIKNNLNNLSEVKLFPNINKFLGITKEPSSNNYIFVLEYANQGNLREYLKNNFNSLQWNYKVRMAFDIASGLLNGMAAYIDPQHYKVENYASNKKSDIFSLGVLLWEIASGYPPFPKLSSYQITYKMSYGFREQPINDTPLNYESLYQKCWDENPNLRPTTDYVVEILKMINLQFNTSDVNEDISEYNYELIKSNVTYKMEKNVDKERSQYNRFRRQGICIILRKKEGNEECFIPIKQMRQCDNDSNLDEEVEEKKETIAISLKKIVKVIIPVDRKPLSKEEKLFIAKWVKNHRTPSGKIHWTKLVSVIERRFGKLRSDNSLKNFWTAEKRKLSSSSKDIEDDESVLSSEDNEEDDDIFLSSEDNENNNDASSFEDVYVSRGTPKVTEVTRMDILCFVAAERYKQDYPNYNK